MIIAAPVGVVHSPFTWLNLTGIFFKISTVAGAAAGITPWAHCINPDPSGTDVEYTLSIFNKSKSIHEPTISTIESIAPTSWKWILSIVVPCTFASA